MQYRLVKEEYYWHKSIKATGEWPTDEREALEESIRKWEFLVEQIEEYKCFIATGGPLSCALCSIYWRDNYKGCPVKESASLGGCRGTPYELYSALSYDDDNPPDWRECVSSAKAEIAFLKSLRKEPPTCDTKC